MAGIKDTDAARIEDRASALSGDAKPVDAPRATAMDMAAVSNAGAVTAAAAVTGTGGASVAETIVEAPLPDSPQSATVSTRDPVHTDAKEAVSATETLDKSLPDSSQMVAPETPPGQIATVSTSDPVHTDTKEAVSSSETLDECLVPEVCINQYLWSVYQRTPKQDTVKVVERKKVIVRIKGKPCTVIQEFTTLIDEDFTWKDPKAAEKAGMSLMEYVIGGMDRDFKLKLYHALRAMDDAGLSPGITSAFRDDYRQSLASGLKAATNRSYHGGSLRGGYGHGLALILSA